MQTFERLRERPSHPGGQRPFSRFKAWLQEHGPFDLVLDGANIGLYGHHFNPTDLAVHQIKMVWDLALRRYPDRKPLLIMHTSKDRVARAAGGAGAAWLASLAANHSYYVTESNTNDDWYWLYVAVTARGNGLLVTNDEARDHMFDMQMPKVFETWKRQHVVRYAVFPLMATIIGGGEDGPGVTTGATPSNSSGGGGGGDSGGGIGDSSSGSSREGGNRQDARQEQLSRSLQPIGASLKGPQRFTVCVQQLPRSGAWMFPIAGRDEWLLIDPVQ